MGQKQHSSAEESPNKSALRIPVVQDQKAGNGVVGHLRTQHKQCSDDTHKVLTRTQQKSRDNLSSPLSRVLLTGRSARGDCPRARCPCESPRPARWSPEPVPVSPHSHIPWRAHDRGRSRERRGARKFRTWTRAAPPPEKRTHHKKRTTNGHHEQTRHGHPQSSGSLRHIAPKPTHSKDPGDNNVVPTSRGRTRLCPSKRRRHINSIPFHSIPFHSRVPSPFSSRPDPTNRFHLQNPERRGHRLVIPSPPSTPGPTAASAAATTTTKYVAGVVFAAVPFVVVVDRQSGHALAALECLQLRRRLYFDETPPPQ